jgi:hypothetical protein
VAAVARRVKHGADDRPLRAELEIEADLRHQPVRRAVIFTADSGGRGRDGVLGVEHQPALGVAAKRRNARASPLYFAPDGGTIDLD